MIPNRFVILWDEQPVGIDSNNGGPFKTNVPRLIKFWTIKEDAEHYINMMIMTGKSNHYSNMRVVEIQFRIVNK